MWSDKRHEVKTGSGGKREGLLVLLLLRGPLPSEVRTLLSSRFGRAEARASGGHGLTGHGFKRDRE